MSHCLRTQLTRRAECDCNIVRVSSRLPPTCRHFLFSSAGYGTTWQSSGSGIYQGGHILNYTFNAGNDNINTLVIAEVPIVTPPHPVAQPLALPALVSTSPVTAANTNHTTMTSKRFTASLGASGSLQVSSGSLQCTITYEVAAATSPPEVYQAMAWFGMGFGGLGMSGFCVCVCVCVSHWVVMQRS